ELDERGDGSGRDQQTPEVGDDRVGRSEQAVERDRALQVAVERMLGREPDAREHLLTVRRDGARRTTGDGLRERGGDRAGLVPRGGDRGVERFDRDQRLGEAVAYGLEP